LYEKLKSILIDDLELTAEDIRPEATLDEAGLDSLAIVDLSIVLNKQYGFEVSDDELMEAATVADIAGLLALRASAGLIQASG
jgi:acyl carrier protein